MANQNMTKFPRYERYKDSGVDWIGEIPEHWEVSGIKNTIASCANGFWGEDPNKIDDLIVLRVADFDRDTFTVSDKKLTYRAIKLNERTGRLLKQGDILLEKSGGGDKTLVGSNVYFNKEYLAITSNFIMKMTPSPSFDSKFINYLFLNLYFNNINYRSIKQTTGIQNLDTNSYLSEKVGIAPLPEQTAIAQFLDHKTAQIDRAIAIKEEQIKLLNERKQIMIQEAVTKGLDPAVPMKDSGVEWIGEIPKHWEVRPLRFLGYTQNGVSQGADYFGSGHPFVSYGDVYNNFQLSNTVKGLANSSLVDREVYSVREGDVFFTRTSETIEEIGIASTCLKTIDDAVFSGFLIRFRPTTSQLEKGFSSYFFHMSFVRKFFSSELNLVTRVSLNQGLLKKLPVLIPPKREQVRIYDYLDNVLQKVNQEVVLYQNQIKALKEYRTILIHEAVTGKIKVN